MEKKRKDIGKPTQSSPEGDTNESKEDQSRNGVNLARKNGKTSSPPHDNVSTATDQRPPVYQWPYTTQSVLKQSPFTSRPSLPTQQPQTVISNQLKTLSFNPQQTPQHHPFNHSLYGSSPSEVTQSTSSFWQPPGPGFLSLGATVTQPFTRIGTADTSWQTSIGAGGRTSAGTEHHLPGFYYQGGHSHPMGLPGTWNPSSWWGQPQPSHPPCTYSFPGAYGFFPIPQPPVSDGLLAFGQNHQKGIIRTEENMSRKHQKMWEAQSLENVQLWAAIGHLRAELAVCGSRLMKLEAEVFSLKSTVELSTDVAATLGAGAGSGSGIALVRQTSKRGRPKKVATASVLPYADESEHPTSGRKPVPNKALSQSKGLNSLKKSLDLEKEKACQPVVGKSNIQQEIDGKMSNGLKNNGVVSELNGSNLKMPQDIQTTSTSNNQIRQDIPRIQTTVNPSSSEVPGKDRSLNGRITAFPVQCGAFKGAEVDSTSTTCKGTINRENHGWASNMPWDCGRNFLNNRSQAFYNNVHLIRQGGKVVPGWSFMNENATEEHEDVVVESGKDDNEEELEDASSGADGMTRAKVEGSYEINSGGGSKFWLN